MKLSYTSYRGIKHVLAWRQHRRGAELLLTGPGFQPAGFSLGVYAPGDLQRTLDTLNSAPARPRCPWAPSPRNVIYDHVYTFTKPARFAPCQGHQTHLGIHAPEYSNIGEDWIGGSPFSPRVAIIYMLGQPYVHRHLGNFRFEHATEFIQEGITTGTPRRVQRRRTAGWKMPPLTVYVGRGSKWGNPWTLSGFRAAGFLGTDAEARQTCVDAYHAWLLGEPHWAHAAPLPPPPDPAELRGYNLACWCRESDVCHADVLLALANPGCPTIKLPSCTLAPLEKKLW